MKYLVVPGLPTVADHIIENVAFEYNKISLQKEGYEVTPHNIKGKVRKRYITEARQVSMFLINKHCRIRNTKRMALKSIGDMFGNRGHATVIHSIKVIDRLKDNPYQLLINKETFNNLLKTQNHGGN